MIQSNSKSTTKWNGRCRMWTIKLRGVYRSDRRVRNRKNGDGQYRSGLWMCTPEKFSHIVSADARGGRRENLGAKIGQYQLSKKGNSSNTGLIQSSVTSENEGKKNENLTFLKSHPPFNVVDNFIAVAWNIELYYNCDPIVAASKEKVGRTMLVWSLRGRLSPRF